MTRLLSFALLAWTCFARKTDFIDCSTPCNGGDVNYELTSGIRIMEMEANIPGSHQPKNYTYKGRTYSRKGDDSFMGPTLHVQPGQSLWIKLRNDMHGEIGPDPPTTRDYWEMLQNPGEAIKYQYYKKPVSRPELMEVDTPNIPSNFNATNLHLHGVDVEVHMFDPVNTHDPTAPHIAVHPGECYCYRFNIPQNHPTGLYWYHPHLHGATAIQMWSGLLGLLYVGQEELPDTLKKYGVTRSQEFVLWDPAFKEVQAPDHNLEVDDFLKGQTTLSKIHPFLVNGRVNPQIATLSPGEVLHLRVLVALVENENTFIVYKQGDETEPWEEVAIPYWVIGADGVNWPKPSQRTILVMTGGQRWELLLQFEEPGNYIISQQGIQGMQFFDMWGHPHDQIVAHVMVTDTMSKPPNRPIPAMAFTPGYELEESIQAHDIVDTETIVFSMGANRNQAPFPQYYINGQPFQADNLRFRAHPGEAREYILVNANHNVHPFHIHVNRFQIQEMGSELSTEKYPVLKALLHYEPQAWHDIVVVPPNGRARIWVHYASNYTGKTVFHCHFLAHEDTGMMSTLFIGPPDYVFKWQDHKDKILGVAAGMLLTAILVLLGVTRVRKSGHYEAVELNELKSKAMD